MEITFSEDFMIIVSFSFFLIGVVLRLIDNSASFFLNHSVFVSSTYVSTSFIKEYINAPQHMKLKKPLMKVLLFRKLHYFFMTTSLVVLIVVLCANIFF